MPTTLTTGDMAEIQARLGEQGVDPDTGLEKGGSSSTVSPLTVSDIEQINQNVRSQNTAADAYLGEGDFGLDPSKYDFQLRYGADNDEIRAQSQSATGMIAKGATRLIGGTATKLLQSVGYLGGGIGALFTGELSTMIDNKFSETFADLEESMKEALPIHKTEAYRNGNIVDQMGTLGFWTDDVVDGAAFMISSIIGAKGMGAAAKGAGAYSKLARSFSTLTKSAKTGKLAGNMNPMLKKFVDSATLGTISTINTVSEAAFEAKDIKDSLLGQFQKEVELGRMTQEEANVKAAEAAKTTFLTNMVLLSPSNLYETALILKGPKNLALGKIFKEGKAAGKTTKEIVDELPTALTKGQKAQLFGKDALGSAISEGVYEENLQHALQTYATARAKGKEENRGLAKGLVENWADNFSTDEGQKAIVLGSLLGLIPGGVGGVKSGQNETAYLANKAAARARSIQMAESRMQDVWKRETIKDENGKVVSESPNLVLDKEDRPIIDESKIKGLYQNSEDKFFRYVEGLKALASGNTELYNAIRFESFSDIVFDNLNEGTTVEDVEHIIDSLTAREVEDQVELGLIEANDDAKKEEIEKLGREYRTEINALNKVYKSITNNYGGIADFGKSNVALAFQQGLVKRQYTAAANQLYLTNLQKELTDTVNKGKVADSGVISGVEGLVDIEATDTIKAGKVAAKKLVEVEGALKDSRANLLDLLSFKKQQVLFDETIAILEKQDAGKSVADSTSVGDADLGGQIAKVQPREVKLMAGEKLSKMTPSESSKYGYTTDDIASDANNAVTKGEGASVYYREFEDGVGIIYTDGTEEGNIISSRKLFGKEMVDPVTKERYRLTFDFVNDDLAINSMMSLENGEVIYDPYSKDAITNALGHAPTPEDMGKIYYDVLPKLKGYTYSENPVSSVKSDYVATQGDKLIPTKTREQLRMDVEADLKAGVKDVVQRINDNKQAAKLDGTVGYVIKDAGKYTPITLFELLNTDKISAKWGDELGLITRENGALVFKSGETNTVYELAGSESNQTLDQLNLKALSISAVDVRFETDGRLFPIQMNGKYYRNPYPSNPSKAIKTRGEEAVSVTLQDPYGETHVFTLQTIVNDLAFAIELNEAVIDRTFDYMLFGQDTDSIVVTDPNTQVNYATYRKDGEYIVYHLPSGQGGRGYKKVKPNSNLYKRVIGELKNNLSAAIDTVAKEYTTEKAQRDGIKSNVKDVRPATPGESLKTPSHSEVSSNQSVPKEPIAEQSSQQVGEQEDTKTIEAVVEDEIKEESAIDQEVDNREDAQAKEVEEQTELTTAIQEGDNIEPLDDKEDVDPVKVNPDEKSHRGIPSSAKAVAYVYEDNDTKELVVANEEFHKHIINNDMMTATFEPVIDYDYRPYWDSRAQLEHYAKSGNMIPEQIEKTLTPEDAEKWDNRVDMIPIKYIVRDKGVTFDKGVFVHQSDYKHLAFTPEELEALSKIKDPIELVRKEDEFRKGKKLDTRAFRREVLQQLLAGNKAELRSDTVPVSKGHLNVSDSNTPLKTVLDELKITPKEAILTIGTSNNRVKLNGEDVYIGQGGRGNIFWITDKTANRDRAHIKLNPAKISDDNAKIVLEAFKQANSKGLSAKFEHVSVTGNLTNQQVLDLLIVQNKEKTKSKKPHLINKQLWVTYKEDIKYGVDGYMPLEGATAEQEKDFLTWITTSKNYAFDNKFEAKPLPYGNFSIGDMHYDAEVDNYNSFVINAGMLNTTVRVVPGTESVTKNPVVMVNPDSIAFQIVPKEQLKQAPAVKDKVETSAPKKVAMPTKALSQIKLYSLDNLDRLRHGSKVYFYAPGVDEETTELGTVLEVNGVKALKFGNKPFTLDIKHLEPLRQTKYVKLDDVAGRNKLKKTVAELDSFLYFDSPAVEEKKDDEIKPDNSSINDTSDTPFRTVVNSKYKQGDVKKAVKWLNKRFKGLDTTVVEGLIELANDRNAFGQARVDGITLSDLLEEGTEYHEAFHRVSLFLMDDKARKGIYAKARKEYNQPDATDSQIEEVLAEKFREYVMLKEEGVKKKGILPAIAKFFTDIWNYITNVFVGPGKLTELEIEDLFDKVEKGRFKNVKISPAKMKALKGTFANLEVQDHNFDTIQTDTQYREITQYLFYLMADASGLISTSKEGEIALKLSNIEDLKKLSYNLLKPRLESIIKEYKAKALGHQGTVGGDTMAKASDMLQEVYDNFEIVKNDLEDYMMSLNITKISDESDIDAKDDLDQETGETRYNFDKFGKSSFESSAKDSTAANIKLLMSILPSTTERSTNTGLFQFAEFGPMWSDILRSSIGIVTSEDMMQMLENKSKGSLPYQVLLKHIKNDRVLQDKLFVTVKKSRLDFITAYYEKIGDTYDVTFGDTVVQGASKAYVRDWQMALMKSNDLLIREQGQQVQLDKDGWDELSSDFDKLFWKVNKQYGATGKLADFKAVSEDISSLLNKVGISLTDAQLDGISAGLDANQDVGMVKLFNNHLQHIFGEEGTLSKLFNGQTAGTGVTLKNALTNEKGVKYLAEKAAELDPLALGDSALGAAGNRYYLVTQHTYLTNEVAEFSKDPVKKASEKLDAIYNKNSVYLNYFKNNPEAFKNFEIKTLAAVINKSERDTGREYQKVTDLEEYINRLSANNTTNKDGIGFAVPPTPGDRKFFQFMKGVPKLLVAIDNDGNLDQASIETFVNYLKDEENRVALTKSQVDDALVGKFEQSNLVESLHYTFFGNDVVQEGEKVLATAANGETVLLKVGESAYFGNGKLLKKQGKHVGRGTKFVLFADADSNATFKAGDKKGYIKAVLEERLQDEIEEAIKLGIISKSGDSLSSLLIPNNIIQKHKDRLNTDNMNLVVRNVMMDNMVNTMMSGIEMQKMFTADLASFKSAGDYVKRITGYTSTGDNLVTNYPTGVWQDDTLITSDEFNSTTFTSHVKKSELYDELIKSHSEYYMGKGLVKSQDEAIKMAKDKLGGLEKVDQTDAQTYITPEMYRALAIKLGEWSDKREAAYQYITNPVDSPTTSQLEGIYDIIFNPLKLTYMKTYQNDKQSYSVFDKMSLSTLFRPIVKGTQLEELLDRMETKGKYKGLKPIHQIKFNTAVKTGGRDRRNLFQDASETEFTDLSSVEIYQQSFNNLRRQLITDAHDTTTIALASQFKKVGMSNIDHFAEYINAFDKNEKMTGRQVLNEISDSIADLSDRGIEGFRDSLNLTKDFKVADKASFVATLAKEAKKANMPQYIVESFKMNDEGTDYAVDFDAIPGARKWIESRIISLIKKAAIDLELPGGAFVQMSDVGLRNLEHSDELKWIDKDGYIETKVSINLFKHVIPGYATMSHDKRVAYLKKYPELVSLGYRVPVQGQNSTYALKIVGFLDENVGDTIILPLEGTAVGGFDFDIDKLYVVRHNYNKQGRIKYLTEENSTNEERIDLYAREVLRKQIKDVYKNKVEIDVASIVDDSEFADELRFLADNQKEDVAKEVQSLIDNWIEKNEEEFFNRPMLKQNVVKAVQNRLLDMYFSVWLNKHHQIHAQQPLGYGANELEKLSTAISNMEGDKNADGLALRSVSPSYQLEIKAMLKHGSTGLAPAALNNTHHILGQGVDLGLFTDLGIGNTTAIDGKNFTSLAGVTGKDNEYITEWLSALIDAHVDIANKPYIYKLNANEYTNPAIALMIRAGVGGLETFKFIAQPILKEIALSQENKDNKLGIDTSNAIKDIENNYLTNYKALTGQSFAKGENKTNLKNVIFNSTALGKGFKAVGDPTLKDADFYKHQLEVLQAFKYVNQYAQKLKEVVSASRVDAKKFGNSMGTIEQYEVKVRKALRDTDIKLGIRNYDNMLNNTYLGVQTLNSIGVTKNVIGSTLLSGTESFYEIRSYIIDMLGKRYYAGEKLINTISDEIYVQIASGFFTKILGMEGKDFANLVYGNNSIPKQIDAIQHEAKFPWLKDNAMIKMLHPMYEQDKPDGLYLSKPDDKWHKDSLVRAWKDILKDERTKELGMELFKYSYVTSGFKPGVFSFYDLAPRELLTEIGYDAYIRDVKKKAATSGAFMGMVNDIIENAWTNNDLVPTIKSKQVYSRGLKGSIISLESNPKLIVGENERGDIIGRPYIKESVQTPEGDFKTDLFKFAGYDKGNRLVYYKIKPKSYYNKGFIIRENGLPDTMIPSNKKGVEYDINDANIEVAVNAQKENGQFRSPLFAGTTIVTGTDAIVTKFYDGLDYTSRDRMKLEFVKNPLSAVEGITEDVIDTVEVVTDNMYLDADIPTGYYVTPSGLTVHIHNLGEQIYRIENYGYNNPSYGERLKKQEECQ